jgi:DNA-directed RNA polymerase beta subunit
MRTTGYLLAMQVRQLMRSFVKTVHSNIYKKTCRVLNIPELFKNNKIWASLRYSCATGNWGTQRSTSNNQTGLCQIVQDTNAVSKWACQRAVNTPLSREGKSSKPRLLATTALGIFCCAETPEDPSSFGTFERTCFAFCASPAA